MNSFALTRQDTSVMKGIAIIAMILHHLYGCPPAGVEVYSGFQYWIGGLGKVCVALFLFCSGYGLTKQYQNVSGVKDTIRFIVKRLIKFYANYWVIFLIFVPIGVFVFNRPLSAAYGENVNIYKNLLLDLLGLQDHRSYNITWWFNTLIIVLYLLFPFFYKIAKSAPWLALLISAIHISIYLDIKYIPNQICTWQFSFVMGMIWQMYEDKWSLVVSWCTKHRILFAMGSLILCGIVVRLRSIPLSPYYQDIRIDAVFSATIALVVLSVIRHMPSTSKVLEFLGKHSINIYLIHSFFNGYWFSMHTGEWLRGGGNFILLMTMCILISIGIEFLKEKFRLYDFVNYIIKRI